jgi:hypothetical protein
LGILSVCLPPNPAHDYLTEHYANDVESIATAFRHGLLIRANVAASKPFRRRTILASRPMVPSPHYCSRPVEKGIHQAYEIRHRPKVWCPLDLIPELGGRYVSARKISIYSEGRQPLTGRPAVLSLSGFDCVLPEEDIRWEMAIDDSVCEKNMP